jgi:hypothetical protein
MGTFLYKTVSLHEYIEKPEGRGSILPYEYVWNQSILIDPEYHIEEFPITYREINLNYKQFIQDMGVLYHYVDTYMKASEFDDIDSGKYIKYSDCMQPDPNLFNSPFFYEWANILYKNIIK